MESASVQQSKNKKLGKPFVWFYATSVNGTAMAIAATLSAYFSLYAQETIGITAGQLSIILLICTLWDAINDPIMGVVCDNLNPKWGRYRTWFTFTPVLLLIDMFLMFSNPGFIQDSVAAKCIYVTATYMFYGMICTAYTMPWQALLPCMTLDDAERNSILSKGAGVCAVAFTIASSFNAQLVEWLGGYRNLMCIYAIGAIICFWGLFMHSKERYVIPKDPNAGGLKDLVYVFRHKEIWPVMLVWCLASVSYGFMFASSVYYAQYIFAPKLVDFSAGEEAIGATIGSTISTYMLFISIGALVSMVFLMGFFLKKFKTGYRAMIISQALTIVCYVVLFFFGQLNWWFACILSFIATCVGAMVNALVNVLVNDTIDFIMLKEGKQLNGVVSSVKGFAQKCGTTVTNSGMLAILAIAGFNAQLGPFGQSASATAAVNVVRFLVPAIVSAIILIIMIFYPLRKHLPAIAEMKAKMAAEHKD